MNKKVGSASQGSAVGEAPTKAKDDAAFLSRWIAYGRMLKAKSDGYGLEWRGKDFQTWIYEIGDADMFAKPEGVNEHA